MAARTRGYTISLLYYCFYPLLFFVYFEWRDEPSLGYGATAICAEGNAPLSLPSWLYQGHATAMATCGGNGNGGSWSHSKTASIGRLGS